MARCMSVSPPTSCSVQDSTDRWCTTASPPAIAREKQIKAGSRARKLVLIESGNPTWRDLYDEIL